MHLLKIKQKVDALALDYESARRTKAIERQRRDNAARELQRTTEAQRICQLVASTIQQRVHSQVANIVTRCLEAVFGDSAYQFTIRFERRRGNTDAVLEFTRAGVAVDPVNAAGGGVVDVAAFGLRLAALLLARPAGRRILVLDEPFRFVSEEYQERVASLLESLAEEMQVQIILVSHNKRLQIGKVVRL